MRPPIAILGAGPAGLTLARILSMHNIDYTVFERDTSASQTGNHGGSLDIHAGSGQLALKEAGLLDEFRRIARYEAQVTRIADKAANVVLKLGDESGEDRPEIDRKDLRLLLLGSVPMEKIRWGERVQRVEREGDSGLMSVSLADGSVESGFKLVVGADGAWSKARALITPALPHYEGRTYLTTSLPPTNPYHPTAASLVGPGMYLALTDGKQLIAQGLADGSYNISVGLPLSETWKKDNAALLADSPALRQHLLREYYSDWSPTVTDLLKNTDAPFRPWPLYYLRASALAWESVPGVTLVGDAAHLQIPDGEGVNRALHDSVRLAGQIAKHGLEGLDEAVREYEGEMLPRTRAEVEASGRFTDMMHADDAPKGLLEAITSGALSRGG